MDDVPVAQGAATQPAIAVPPPVPTMPSLGTERHVDRVAIALVVTIVCAVLIAFWVGYAVGSASPEVGGARGVGASFEVVP